MKKKIKTAAAALLLIPALLCGCDNTDPSSSGAPSSVYTESEPASSAFDIPDSAPQTESPYLEYFGNKELSEAALALYAKNSSAENGSGFGLISVTRSSESDYQDALSAMISSDNSPDLADKRPNSFPYLMSRNFYEDLTPFMDVSAPQWTDYADYIAQYSFKDKNYFYPTSVTVMPQFLVYDKMNFVVFGIPDPEKMWERGEWTWESFEHSVQSLRDQGGYDCAVYGLEISENFAASAGGALFSKDESGRIVSNLTSETLSRVWDFISPSWNADHASTDGELMRQQSACFLSADEKTLGAVRQLPMNIGIVPYPRGDSSEKYFYKAESDGFLVPKGAKNVKSAASFINCSRIADSGDEQRENEKKKALKSGLLRSDIEWLDRLRASEDAEIILTDTYCFDDETNAKIREMLTALGTPNEEELSSAELIRKYATETDGAVEEINKVIE